MPKSEYYKGRGAEVYRDMKKRYGARAEEVFYATANAKHMNPEDRDSGVKRSMRAELRRKRKKLS